MWLPFFFLLAFAAGEIVRMPGPPAILPDMLPPADGDNINFPSIIAVPSWLRLHGRSLGAYYMYFSSHKGAYIRLAYSDSIDGPWTVHANGTDLRLARVAAINNDTYDSKGHTASPDVSACNYHFLLLGLGHQAAYAYSDDGIRWNLTPGAVHPRPYLRRFALPGIGGGEYVIDRDVGIYRVTTRHPNTGRPIDFVLENPLLLFNALANVLIVNGDGNSGIVRHVGIDMRPSPLFPAEMDVYGTRIGDAPERIVVTRVVLRRCTVCPYLDPAQWSATQATEAIRPATVDEGADEPNLPSDKGVNPSRGSTDAPVGLNLVEHEIKRAQQENAHAAMRHADKLRKFEHDLKKYEKEKVEKHSPCKGTGWIKCDNYWHRHRNPVLAKCPTCYGKGGHTCMLCKGTGLKFPKLEPPKAPKTRPLPTFPPISSIDFTRDIA